ncbi:MFS transporter [Halorientalis marina]|uniref:MFS transporter n=1 Tax=Halorientalis marina TaxID=2931976 RepID=UPI001FF6FA82|nr:MFS transporter [Halorientalis marina]
MLPRATTLSDAGPSNRRALAAVVAVVFIDLVGFGIVIPILPFYVRSFGVSDVFIGLLAASYSLMQFVSAPYLGRLSDERGRRPVIMLSLAGSAVAWVLFGLGAELQSLFGLVGGLGAVFAARMLAGAMGGNIAAAQAYIADVTPREERAAALGLIGAAFGLGFVFGPALGAVFASDSVVAAADALLPGVVPTTRFSVPSFAAAGFSLLGLLAAAVALPEPERKRGPAAVQGIVAQFRGALADSALRPLVAVFLLWSLAFSGVQVAFIPFVADVYGYDASGAGLLLTYIGVLGVLNQGIVVRALTRRVSDARIALSGAVLLVAALAALPFTPLLGRVLFPAVGPLSGAVVALLVVLAGLSTGNGWLSVGASALVSASADDANQGSAFGVTQGAGSLGRTVGPPLMTALYVAAVAAPFLLGAALTAVVVGILTAVIRGVVPTQR